MKTIKRILLIFIILFSLTFLTIRVFYPSYLSVYSACFPNSFNETYGKIYYTVGSLTVNESSGETNIYIADYQDIKTIKHEHIHLIQYNQGRLFNCRNLFLKYFNEVEAYSFSMLPDKIYSLIYNNNFL